MRQRMHYSAGVLCAAGLALASVLSAAAGVRRHIRQAGNIGSAGRRAPQVSRIGAAGQLQLRDRLRGELRIAVGGTARCQ